MRPGEVILFETKSALNDIVVTGEHGGRRTLRFGRDGARQSVVKLGDPSYLELDYCAFVPAFLALVPNPENLLLVGLGGGTLAGFLQRYLPDTTIDAVEIDPVVVQVARDYFGLVEDDRLRAHVANGRAFIEQRREAYDVIVLDGFGASRTPLRLTTLEFLDSVKTCLTGQGVAVANIWGRSGNPRFDAALKTYAAVFPGLHIIDTGSEDNFLLLCASARDGITPERFAANMEAVQIKRRLPMNLARMLPKAFRDLASLNIEEVAPLADKDVD